MLKHIKSNLKNTYGFIISIPNIELASNCPAGITHFGEHLMFSGTKSYSSERLRIKHAELFEYLEATTSRDRVKIFGYLHKRHLAEAVNVLKEMVFDWKCRPSNFEEELRDAIAEAEEYYQTNDYRRRKSAYQCLPIRNYEPVGDLQWLGSLKIKDLKKIKNHWQTMTGSEMNILLVGKDLDAKMKKMLGIFDIGSFTAMHRGVGDNQPQMIDEKEIKGWFLNAGTYRLETLVLNRIYRARWQKQGEYQSEYEHMNVGGVTAFYIYKEKGLNPKYTDKVFKPKITSAEFAIAKRNLLDHFDFMNDNTDLIGSLLWYEGFLFGNYDLPKGAKDIDGIYDYYKKLRVEDLIA